MCLFYCVQGGNAANAIPRDAEAVIFVPSTSATAYTAKIQEDFAAIKKEFGHVEIKEETKESSMVLEISNVTLSATDLLLTGASSRSVMDFILNMPHGPLALNALGEVFTSIAYSLSDLPKRDSTVKIEHHHFTFCNIIVFT